MPKTSYIWDFASDSYLMEQDGDGNTTAVYTNEPVQYGKLISQRRDSTTSYYHFDGQGSTRQLTEQTGNVTDEYVYTALGESVASSGTTTDPFQFVGITGYYFDTESATYYIRARVYVPHIARWLSIDPIGVSRVVTNLYDYVWNQPVVRTDPGGDGVPPLPALCNPVGAIVGTAVVSYYVGQKYVYPQFVRIAYRLADPWVKQPPIKQPVKRPPAEEEHDHCHCYCLFPDNVAWEYDGFIPIEDCESFWMNYPGIPGNRYYVVCKCF